MPHRCEGCGKIYSERKQLHRHEGKCSKLMERSDRQWNLMREAEKDPEERKKRRLAEEVLLDDETTFDRFKNFKFMKRKRVKTSSSGIDSNPLGEGPSGLGTSVSLETPVSMVLYLTRPNH